MFMSAVQARSGAEISRSGITFLSFDAAACHSHPESVTDARERSPHLMYCQVTNACEKIGGPRKHMLSYRGAECTFLNNSEINKNDISGMYSFS